MVYSIGTAPTSPFSYTKAMNWYLMLLVLYVLLLGYYWWSMGRDEPQLSLWTRIDSQSSSSAVNTKTCKDQSDCPPDHLCVDGGECVPKALRGGKCDPATGDWVVERDARGKKVATCVCRHPHLVTQKLRGGNCDVDVACAPHGRIADLTKLDSCDCDEGYVPVPGLLKCRRLTAVEYQQTRKPPCDSDEDELANAVSYDYGRYLSYHEDKKCFKRVCGFDVLTGRSFSSSTATTYDQEMGCVCDPSLGRFGVRMDSDFSRLNHYNGCASVFAEEPYGGERVDVEVHAYFYLLDATNDSKPVVSFLVFKNLNPDDVNPVFRVAVVHSGGTLVLEQDWPHDHMQYVLRKGGPFRVHSRECHATVFSYWCDEWVMKNDAMEDCRQIGKGLSPQSSDRKNAYHLLYAYPVCHINERDQGVKETYRGRFVVNPYHALYTDFPELLRSNSLVMKRDRTQDRWLIDFGKDYEIEFLMRNSAQVPDVWDARARDFADGRLNNRNVGVYPRPLATGLLS